MTSPIDKLVHGLSQLPGIGEKTATRLAFFIFKQKSSYAESLAAALSELHGKVQFCRQCQNLTQENPCKICIDMKRESKMVLVVETPQDMMAIERSHSFRGTYHILHGAISPLDGVGPEDIKVGELMDRVSGKGITEVILGTNPNVEGEATSLYISKLLTPMGIKVTRLASGMPVGTGIEYLDPLTLQKALEGRQELETSENQP